MQQGFFTNEADCVTLVQIIRRDLRALHDKAFPSGEVENPLSIPTVAVALPSSYDLHRREVVMRSADIELLRAKLESLLRDVEYLAKDGQPFPPHYIDDLKLLAHLLQSYGYTASTVRSSDGALVVILDHQVEDAA